MIAWKGSCIISVGLKNLGGGGLPQVTFEVTLGNVGTIRGPFFNSRSVAEAVGPYLANLPGQDKLDFFMAMNELWPAPPQYSHLFDGLIKQCEEEIGQSQ